VASPRKEIEALLEAHADDRELAGALMELSRRVYIGSEVAWWAPMLYERNRVVFLPLIERNVNSWALTGVKNLDQWMARVEENRDFRLYRVLYQASLSGARNAQARWRDDLLSGFRAAPDRGTRRDVVDKYDIWYEIDDELAAELYAIDPPVTRELLLRRIDRARWWDVAYEETAELARSRGDEDFYFELYRRTFGRDTWSADVRRLAREVSDPAELCRELDRRHGTGPDAPVDPKTLVELLQKRGAAVFPYLERRVADVQSWGDHATWKRLADLARDGGWLNLWGVVVSSHFPANLFSDEVARLCAGRQPPLERAAKLLRIAGAKHGWGSWRRFTGLEEKAATALYDAFPLLCRSAFGVHLLVTRQTPYLALAERAAKAGDTEMIDLLAARAAVADTYPINANLDWYVDHYRALSDVDFAARAVNVLGLIEPPNRGYRTIAHRETPLYRLLFDDPRRYLPAIDRARDLLESTYEGSRRMAMRMIAAAGDAGVDAAVGNVDHLGAYLLDEASRATRIAALDALAVAAEASPEIAADVLARARAALDLRRKRYPRDRVIELIGRILWRWPELRGDREQPVIHRREASW
jgi:hypothetical protein